MGSRLPFLICIGLICFGITLVVIARFGSSAIWFVFAIVPFALASLGAHAKLRGPG